MNKRSFHKPKRFEYREQWRITNWVQMFQEVFAGAVDKTKDGSIADYLKL